MKKTFKFFGIIALVAIIGLSMAACFSTGPSTYASPTLTIVNNTGYTMWYVFVSLSSDDSWGSDWLGPTEYLYDKQSKSIQLGKRGVYDIMLIDNEEDEYTKWNVSITSDTTVIFTLRDLD